MNSPGRDQRFAAGADNEGRAERAVAVAQENAQGTVPDGGRREIEGAVSVEVAGYECDGRNIDGKSVVPMRSSCVRSAR